MKTERKILVCENGKLVLKTISLAYKSSDGETAYLFEPEKTADRNTDNFYENVENNLLLIGLLRKVDMSKMDNADVEKLMLRKHEKEERFFTAAKANGYNVGVDMNPADILRFYISLTPEERVALECKP